MSSFPPLHNEYGGDNPQSDHPELWNYYIKIIDIIRRIIFDEVPMCESDPEEPIFKNPHGEILLNTETKVIYNLQYNVDLVLQNDIDDETFNFTNHRVLTVELVKSNKKIMIHDHCLNDFSQHDLETFYLIKYDDYDDSTSKILEQPRNFKKLLNIWLHIERGNHSNWGLQQIMHDEINFFIYDLNEKIKRQNEQWLNKMEHFLTTANIDNKYDSSKDHENGHRVWQIEDLQRMVRQVGLKDYI